MTDPKKKTFFVYILQCFKFDPKWQKNRPKLYTGFTSNLARRMKEHGKGKSKYTSRFKYFKLVFTLELNTRSEAIHLEKVIKKLKRKDKLFLIASQKI